MSRPLLSVVIPAYNASRTVGATIASLRAGEDRLPGELEIVVVDDGSADGAALEAVVAGQPRTTLLRHDGNRGMCAARNTGLFATTGAIVTVLDADDVFVPEWPETLAALMAVWPEDCHLAFSACRTPDGRPTVAEPAYTGMVTMDDFLNERHSGEYLPLFRGDYIRALGYVDLAMRRSCGQLSYLRFLEDGPIFAFAGVLRVYDDGAAGSVSRHWGRRDKALENALCMNAVLERHGALYHRLAPWNYHAKWRRLAVYRRLAGMDGAFAALRRGWRWGAVESYLVLGALLLGSGSMISWAVSVARSLSLLRRYG